MIYLKHFADPESVYTFSVWPWLGGGILYAIGAILYALKFPERRFPGKFDIFKKREIKLKQIKGYMYGA